METTEVSGYRDKLVETFRAFIAFCKKYDLQYMVCAGTCIGAVRHNGMIPWDDDIDVFMKRKDYERLLSLRNSFPAGYHLVTMGEDGYCAPIPKFCNSNTTLWEEKSIETVIGIYIDIFPLDECCDDVGYCMRLKRRYEKCYLRYQDANRVWNMRDLADKLFHLHPMGFLRILRNLTLDRLLKRHYLRRYNSIHSEIISMTGSNMTGFDGLYATVYPKYFFDTTVECDFEEIKVNLPVEYDEYLRMTYGDYMTPPPENRRISTHSHYFIDLQKGMTLEEAKQQCAARK